MPHLTAIVTLLAILLYAATGIFVSQARRTHGVAAPATTGNADFERVFRVQMNMLEWMPIFLPLLWLFAFYVGDLWAAALGVVWIAGRALYIQGYSKAADKRGPGFGIQAIACGALLAGDAIAIIIRLAHGG